MFADIKTEPDICDEDLATLKCAVLLFYGNHSPLIDSRERLLRLLPQAQLRELGGGHFLLMDAPAELVSSIVELLDG